MRLGEIIACGVVLGGVVAATSCGGDADVAKGRKGGSGGSSAAGGDASTTGGTGGLLIDGQAGGTGSECSSDEQCDGGVCTGGVCCPSAERACSTSCCAEGEFCSFERCVVPGKPCQNPADCDEDQYCETALGDDPDGGTGGGPGADAGRVCSQPVSANGRCIDLPPICGEGDAGAPDGGTCVDRCEFVPDPGTLETVVKWQWGYDPAPTEFPAFADVWNTPTVGRVYDADCDGDVDESDPPNVVFVSGDNETTCCHCNGKTPHSCLTGVLRVLDGRSGQELISLDKAKPGNFGFAGTSVALGDIDGDQKTDIVAMTGDGYIVHVDSTGAVVSISDQPVDSAAINSNAFGWGGGISLGDMDGDGAPEIAFGRTLYTTSGGGITRLWVGSNGKGGTAQYTALSFFADVAPTPGGGPPQLELVAGNTAYRLDGSTAWVATISDGFPATGDFDGDGAPEVVVAERGRIHVLEGADGTVELTGTMPDAGGGAPTVADFNGDGEPEIGVAQQNVYVMMKPNYAGGTIDVQWTAPTHDLSSNVTGSSVFDFDGDGKAEVVYNDECFLWVYDGTDGTVLLVELTQSFTGTEASIVADVDGDGHAEIVMISNGANPTTWKCNVAALDTARSPSARMGAAAERSGVPRHHRVRRQGEQLGRHPHGVEPAQLPRHQRLRLPRQRVRSAEHLRLDPRPPKEELAAAVAQQLPPERAGQRPVRRPRRDRRAAGALLDPGRRHRAYPQHRPERPTRRRRGGRVQPDIRARRSRRFRRRSRSCPARARCCPSPTRPAWRPTTTPSSRASSSTR